MLLLSHPNRVRQKTAIKDIAEYVSTMFASGCNQESIDYDMFKSGVLLRLRCASGLRWKNWFQADHVSYC